jgi:flagellin-like hook-associated protein FlgL
MADGGALSGLGFSITTGATATTVQIDRENVAGQGQLVGFAVDDGNVELTNTAASPIVNEAAGGNVQVEIAFNSTTRNGETEATQLKAGDEIDVIFNDGTNDHKFTLVVGEDNEYATTADGTAISGSANKYQLSYESAVTKDTGEAVTVSELANRVKEVLLNEGGTNAAMNTAIGGAVTIGDFTITNNNNKVTIVDTNQAAANTESLVGFNMNNSTGGSLDFDYLLDQVNAAESHLNSVAAQIGAAQSALESQDTFMESLVNAVEDGIGTLVDANMAEESAKFQALQVQQQLGLQALSIANQQPQSILSLFR